MQKTLLILKIILIISTLICISPFILMGVLLGIALSLLGFLLGQIINLLIYLFVVIKNWIGFILFFVLFVICNLVLAVIPVQISSQVIWSFFGIINNLNIVGNAFFALIGTDLFIFLNTLSFPKIRNPKLGWYHFFLFVTAITNCFMYFFSISDRNIFDKLKIFFIPSLVINAFLVFIYDNNEVKEYINNELKDNLENVKWFSTSIFDSKKLKIAWNGFYSDIISILKNSKN